MNASHINYDKTIVMVGYGVVAQCLLPMIFRHIKLAKKVIILDRVDTSPAIPAELKDKVVFHSANVVENNYEKVFSQYLKAGDVIIDLAYDIDCATVLDWCHKNNVLYMNTSVEVWDPYAGMGDRPPTERTLYARHMIIRDMIAQWDNKKGVTAVIDHGANPGLVSHFAKRALIDISNKLITEKPNDSRIPAIKKAQQEKNFAQLSHLLHVKVIHISERDTQIISEPRRINEFVNTWSIAGLYEEGISPAELGWGTHEKTLPSNALTHDKGPKNQICLAQMGIDTWVRSWVPSGDIHGMIVRHGESFTLSEHLTHYENGKAVYRPTVHYAYCPTDAALNSLFELKMRNLKMQEAQRIARDEIVSGVDELGVLLMGHDYTSWWAGTILSIEESRKLVPNQNATTMQVAASALAALIWMIQNPAQGVCVPDDLPHEEILAIASPYLGSVISQQSDWNPFKSKNTLFEKFSCRVQPKTEDDMWQFSSFLVLDSQE